MIRQNVIADLAGDPAGWSQCGGCAWGIHDRVALTQRISLMLQQLFPTSVYTATPAQPEESTPGRVDPCNSYQWGDRQDEPSDLLQWEMRTVTAGYQVVSPIAEFRWLMALGVQSETMVVFSKAAFRVWSAAQLRPQSLIVRRESSQPVAHICSFRKEFRQSPGHERLSGETRVLHGGT